MSNVTKPIMLNETGEQIVQKLAEMTESNKSYEMLLNTKADKVDVSAPFNFKGDTTYASLPTSGNKLNDTYYCSDEKCRYTWNGEGWYQSSMNEVDYTDELAKMGEDLEVGMSQLSSEIGDANTELKDINGYFVTDVTEWESGSINGGTGANAGQPARIRTKGYLPNNIKIIPSQGIKCMGVYYDDTHSVVASGVFFEGEHTFNNVNATCVRLVVGFTDDRVISQSDIENVVDLFTIRLVDNALSNIKNDTVSLSYKFENLAFKYVENMETLGITSFYGCIERSNTPSYYNFTANYLNTITDKPSDLTSGGIVEVFPYFASSVTIQWITDTKGNKWFRWGNNEFKKIISSTMLADIEQLKGVAGSVWYALGDSITQGFCSYLDESGNSAIKIISDCWAKKVADLCGYTLFNYGVGGSGYVHNGTVLDKLNARDHVDTIDFSNCKIATLAYGINDWKYNMILGSMADDVATGGTFYSNMRYVIEKILGDNPLCKIVVITPLNCSAYGNEVTNWGIGHSFSNNGTLEDIFEAEKEVCEYYGIELIDMTHNSVVNRKNITSALPDGVHPSEECHGVIAKELAKKINFK